MKINRINPNYNNNNILKKNNNVKTYNEKYQSELISYPANYYIPTFRGINLSKMYDEYNWYINHDKIPAIKSFLKIIAPKEEMDEFLTHILSTNDRSYQFIDSIVSLPREAKNILNALAEKVGSSSKNIMPFVYDSPYNNAYQRYIEQKYNNAHTLSELLKVRPDWSGKVLMEKYISLAGNDELKIGNIPKQVPKEHLDQIITYLSEKMEIGVKSDKKIDNLVIGGSTYEFKFFTEGKSSKNVFGLFVPAMMKKYVIKMDSLRNRSLDEPFALGTLAKIDKYLTANRSRNSAPLCYYDHARNFSIYKYIEHSPIDERPTSLDVIKKHLPDFKALGLDYNDTVGYKNFFALNEHSLDTHYRMDGYQEALNSDEWISVDNDHVTYNNRLQPIINNYIKTLPNAMGIAIF